MTETQTATLTKQTGTYLHIHTFLFFLPQKNHVIRVIAEPFVTSTLVFGFCYLVSHIYNMENKESLYWLSVSSLMSEAERDTLHKHNSTKDPK